MAPLFPCTLRTNLNQRSDTQRPDTPRPENQNEEPRRRKGQRLRHQNQRPDIQRPRRQNQRPDTQRHQTQRPENQKERNPPKVSLIGANTFAFICNQPGTEFYFMTMEEANAAHLASQEMGAPDPNPNLSTIPLEYYEFAYLFSKKEADKLSNHRTYDHEIPLEPGKAPPFGPIYKLSPMELEVVRKYITDNLKKGFIRHSQSPCGAPIVFAKKADGTLWLCVDY